MPVENINSKSEYQKMQELLPDYVLNRAAMAEAEFFEGNLSKYPDLEEEANSAREVFAKLEQMDTESDVKDRVRNLSVRVNNRMQKREPIGKYNFFMRYITPALGLSVIVFLAFNGLFNDNTPINNNGAYINTVAGLDEPAAETLTNEDFEILTPSEEAVILQGAITNEDISRFTADLSMISANDDLLDEGELESELDDMYEESLAEHLSGMNTDDIGYILSPAQTSNQIIEGMNGLDESEIQLLLEEIRNAEINS